MFFLRTLYKKIPTHIRYRYFSPIISPLVASIQRFLEWREHKVCYGEENPDKVFYVIRMRFMGGLFGLMGHYIPQIQYALKKGYVPVIDMQNYKNMYLDEVSQGKENAWEYYFLQPCDCTLNDIAHSRNIILGMGGGKASRRKNNSRIIFDKEIMRDWHNVYKKYIRMNEACKKYCESQYKKLFSKDDIVLGVLSRGTDYINCKPHAHPVQPEPDIIIKKSKEYAQKYGCNKIFLATEDKRIWNAFYNAFGNKLVTNEHALYSDTGNQYLPNIATERKKSVMGLEYLATIFILSRCPYLVAGNCGGSQAAMYISDGYKDSYIFDLGLYR